MTRGARYQALAVDGGGTRCRIAFLGKAPPSVVEVGSVNVSTDLDAALAELQNGLAVTARQAGSSLEDLGALPAYLGLAGMTGPELASRISSALPFHHVRIEDDRPSALRGALGRRDGIVIHCGTGSFAAAQNGSHRRLVGGWGPTLGDEASAQWVGRRALSRTLDTVDGLIAPSKMSQSLLAKFGGPANIVSFAGAASPADLGEIAVEVTQAAAAGDAIGQLVMAEAASQVRVLIEDLGWKSGTAICLTGGIGPHYAALLPDAMQGDLTPALGEPLTGALALAEDFLREVSHEHR